MLNPNEIASKKFDRMSMGRAYKAEEVDNYLSQLADEVDALLQEKRDLEKKMMVLADKLEEYKGDEESLRAALLGAQKLGGSVVRDAKAKAEQIIDDANAKANLIVENAKKEIERQQSGFVRMQREVATFKSKLQLLYKQHLELISSIPVDENIVNAAVNAMSSRPQRQEEANGASSMDSDFDQQPIDSDSVTPEETLPEPVDEYDVPLPIDDPSANYDSPLEYTQDEYVPEEQPVKRESRFGPLRFGKDFDIKRDEKRKR